MASTPDGKSHEEVTAFLADPKTHDIEGPVEVIETHCAVVFLAGDRAYKIKRPVRYDYLDFSTLAKRQKVLLRELSLNMPAAPTIYERVVSITREPSGALALDGSGEVIEYVLVMNRFPAEAELSSIADAGDLTEAIASELGRSIGNYHAAAAPVRTGEGAILIREIIDELDRVFADMNEALGKKQISRFLAGAEAQLHQNWVLLDQRAKAGKVRRCHGDLHLKNLVMVEGRPVPFDALEFDERLGTCDVYYDIAFLIMDLWHRRLLAQANAMLNSYVLDTGDVEGLGALPLFLGIRSAIRAMVDVQTWRLTGEVALARNAATYLEDAHSFLQPSPPCLLAIGGLSGSGKTTVARRLAPEIGAPPGALHVRSDLERKAMFGVDEMARLPAEAYSDDATERTYRRLFDKAALALAAGHGVILDATFSSASNRRVAEQIANVAGVPFFPIWLSAPPKVLIDRVRTRTLDASDATEDVVRAQIAATPDAKDWAHVDASGDLASTLATVKRLLEPEAATH